MKKKIKKMWVKALRSGKYEQGSECLVKLLSDGTMRYCCLGVLTELAVEHGVLPPGSFELNGLKEYEYEDGSELKEITLLPAKVADWAGLKSIDPDVILAPEEVSKYITEKAYDDLGIHINAQSSGNELTTLAALNDVGLSFKKIAKLIEAKY